MALRMLPPDEAKRRARANVAQWKREKEADALRSRLAGKSMPEPAMGQDGEDALGSGLRGSGGPEPSMKDVGNPTTKELLSRLPEPELIATAIDGEPGAIEYLESKTERMEALIDLRSRLGRLRKEMGSSGDRDVPAPWEWIVQTTRIEYDIEGAFTAIDEGIRLNAGLREAAEKGSNKEVERLLDAGADVDTRDPKTGETPLLKVVKDKYRLATAVLLIEHGADVNATDNSGNSAYQMAVMMGGHSLMTDLLLEKGAKR